MSVRPPLMRRFGMIAGAASAAGAGAVRYLLRRPLPQLSGELALHGPHATVDIVRDRWGIPHIRASNEHDAFFAQGFCHAQDRLWQMDLSRRLARGQLAEVLGKDALDVDRFTRRVGFHRAAQAEWDQLEGDLRLILQAYVDGVNAHIDGVLATGRLPVEYALLRMPIRRWEPLDTLSFGRFFSFTQSPNWESELMRSRLIARLGYVAAAALEPDVWQPGAGAIPHLEDWGPTDLPEHTDLVGLPPVGPVGSNAWVVSGKRSTTGKPLLANDPHLFPRLPAIFYEAHLTAGGDLNVAGASLPGVPGIAIGHNRHIAWGVTSGMLDAQDFYVERVAPGDPRRFEYQGRWETGTLVREQIQVKGRPQPWIEDVLVTRHGPLVTPTPAIPDEHRPLALRSVVLEGPETLGPILALNRATDWESFRAALSCWHTPAMNFVYADVDGNIGFQLAGRVPKRARGEGLVPSPGWTGEYEWTGWVPFDEMPRAFNPDDGLWATANHNCAKGNSHFYTREFIDSARYHRIRQVLEHKERHSAVDFRMLQADEVSLPARAVAQALVAHLRPTDELGRKALEELRHWNGCVSSDSPAATIYHVFRRELPVAQHGDRLGDLISVLWGEGPHPVIGPVSSFYFRLTMRVRTVVLDWAEARRSGQPHPSGMDEIEMAFDRAVRWLRERLGPNVEHWQWGRVHKLSLEHPLSVQKALGLLFNVPSFRWSGDLETVRAGGSLPGRLDASGPISGYRFIADVSDWDASLACIPGGQSGHRGSHHYADQVDDWRRIAYHPLAFTRPAVARYARHTLRLQPAG